MIWFDLDNSPHVPLFRPILAELHRRGTEVHVTSRRHAQTEDLLNLWKIPHVVIGAHGGRGRIRKVANLLQRAVRLREEVRGKPVTLAVSHGSRTQILAAASLRIPVLVMDDYEYSNQTLTRWFADTLLVPEAIPTERWTRSGVREDRLLTYPGFKEEVYLRDFSPDPSFRSSLGIPEQALLVTLRPPSVSANYHDPRSERLFSACLQRLSSQEGVLCLVVNRTEAELRLIPDDHLAAGRIRLLSNPVDGLQLLWASDMVISGGGTMNREAALLGIPTYSVFTGRRPAMDERLVAMGRMTFIESSRDVERFPLARRDRGLPFVVPEKNLASQIADAILEASRRRG
jgi:predicted glycosyltransferase